MKNGLPKRLIYYGTETEVKPGDRESNGDENMVFRVDREPQMILRAGLVLAFLAAILVGCRGQISPRQLDLFSDLPSHWHHYPEQGIDTEVGCFWSDELGLEVVYDVGDAAGEYVGESAPPAAEWVRVDSFQGVEYRSSLSGEYFVITIPAEGPANYVARVSDQDEIHYLLELVLKYRTELHRLKSESPSSNMNPCDFEE